MLASRWLVLSIVTACASLGGCSGGDDAPPVDPRDAGMTVDAEVATDAPAAVIDPAVDGPASVSTMSASIPGRGAGRTLSSTVFVPSSAGPRALVVVSPGFQMSRAQYTSYSRHLASWGFVVVLTDYAESGFFIDHARLAADVGAVIDWALTQPALAVDPQRIATAGHSLGGKISVFAATLDARVRAVVAWDPVDSNSPSVAPERMAGVTAAIAVVGETTNGSGGFMPCAPAADNFQTFYAASPAPALQMTIVGADHMDWVDDPSCGVCGLCTAGTAPNERARTATRRLDVAWLRRQLFGDRAMDRWLDMPPEVGSGAATVQRR